MRVFNHRPPFAQKSSPAAGLRKTDLHPEPQIVDNFHYRRSSSSWH